MTGTTVSGFFDSYAEEFNAIYGTKNTLLNRVVSRLFRKSMRLRFERTLEGCQPINGMTAIDIGTGPGHYAIALARAGAARVLGVDFAEGMVDVAKKNAERSGVGDNCRFDFGDFFEYQVNEVFDYAIVMGFMDYVADQPRLVEKVLSMTRRRAFFSFPVAGGLLAWQRQIRYKSRCELILYTREQIEKIFEPFETHRVTIESLGRDFFVTAEKTG